ncbi:hypothetical protein K040078D81_43960 [Blautia hominis]|uniref:Prealbumin-like fold domain-containing protein n=1 Tax=Blautia hominis TaxID=2025493 RepID=A0ABQ0BFP1_9FIRM
MEGAEFKVYEWDDSINAYKESALCTLKYDQDSKRYVTETPVERTEDNAGKFRIVETKLPKGYQCPWSEEIEVKEKGTVTIELDALNYPERSLTIEKKIKVDEITWAHGNPTFMFAVKGTDRNGKEHSYHRAIEFTQDYVAGHSVDGFVTLNTVIQGIPAGEYKVEEIAPVMRYILTDVVAGSDNISIIKQDLEEINGFIKIQANVTADLRDNDGEVVFVNHKTRYDKVSHNTTVINKIIKSL